MTLSDVTIGITSLLRPGYLKACLEGIANKFPECRVIIADDSDNDLCAKATISVAEDHKNSRSGLWSFLCNPFDVGLTVKRNAIVANTVTPYWFCGSDDFDFSTPQFKEGLEAATLLLDTNPDIDLVGGRCNNNPYESNLEYDAQANIIQEHRIKPDGYHYQKCDLTVNVFLARTATLLEVPWDEDVRPIGGEHGQFFWHMKKAGKTTVWMPGFNINTLSLGFGPNVQDPRYGGFRRRAFATGHTIMLKKEGINDWIGA